MNIGDLGIMVRERRKELALTQVALAELSGVSRVRISHLERGDVHDMSWANVRRILEALDLSIRIGPANAGRPVLDDLLQQRDDLYDTPRLG